MGVSTAKRRAAEAAERARQEKRARERAEQREAERRARAAWRPVLVRIEGKRYHVHRDGSVYKRDGRAGPLRKVKDEHERARIYARFLELHAERQTDAPADA